MVLFRIAPSDTDDFPNSNLRLALFGPVLPVFRLCLTCVSCVLPAVYLRYVCFCPEVGILERNMGWKCRKFAGHRGPKGNFYLRFGSVRFMLPVFYLFYLFFTCVLPALHAFSLARGNF